ncbi:cold and drought-regulated protein CORA-like [Prunus yedoensis var. nudiflora]|uniref:Cold and drought-regulated protein CORA-like n=1 Tax=Prunus yedoensis var. nudiflora TaxID=2094558 RepID=A0A314ZK97_PRUYE|nr:cold and drought-regulated protein CORA-like [Prunus yedoensis var. nudiflora]
MARNSVGIGDSHADELLPSAGGGLFLFCMILMSLSVISALIFSCGKSSRKKKHNNVPNVLDTFAYGHHGNGGGGHGDGGGGGCGGVMVVVEVVVEVVVVEVEVLRKVIL